MNLEEMGNKLQCSLNAYRVTKTLRQVDFYIERSNHADRQGAIDLAIQLLPNVHAICVWTGRERDDTYLLGDDGQWRSDDE